MIYYYNIKYTLVMTEKFLCIKIYIYILSRFIKSLKVLMIIMLRYYYYNRIK